MSNTIGIIGGNGHQLEGILKTAGYRSIVLQADRLVSPATAPFVTPDVLLVDVRPDRGLLTTVAAIKRRYPTVGIVLIVESLDPTLMLEAMRAGVTECIPEPVSQDAVETAVSRVMVQRDGTPDGRVYAVVGAKGGVGTTTIAVNLAEAFAQETGSALLMDLHAAWGDAAVFLGAEPKFSIAEALDNTHRLDEAFFRSLVVHTKSGLDLLAAPSGLSVGHLDPGRVRTVIDFAVRYYRAVVLDVPGVDGAILDALDIASVIFVVLNHELPTVRSAHRLMAALRKRYGPDRVNVLVNRSDQSSDISLGDIEKAVSAKVRHSFPSDYKLALAAVNKGEPFAHSTQGRLPSSFHALVRSLTGQAKAAAPEPASSSGGLFGWLSPKRS